MGTAAILRIAAPAIQNTRKNKDFFFKEMYVLSFWLGMLDKSKEEHKLLFTEIICLMNSMIHNYEPK